MRNEKKNAQIYYEKCSGTPFIKVSTNPKAVQSSIMKAGFDRPKPT
jgi:hypothetical protein